MDVARAFCVNVSPLLDKNLQLNVRDPTTVLDWDLLESLQGDGDEEIDQNNPNEKDVGCEEGIWTRCAATYRLISIFFEVLKSGIRHAIIPNAVVSRQVFHDLVPALTRHDHYESEKRVSKSLKVYMIVQWAVKFYMSEESITNTWENVDHHNDKAADIEKCWYCVHKRIENGV